MAVIPRHSELIPLLAERFRAPPSPVSSSHRFKEAKRPWRIQKAKQTKYDEKEHNKDD